MWDSLIAFYGTKDLEQTHKFYVDALGLNLYQDQGTCRIYQVTEGGLIGFCQHLDIAISGRSPIITLVTDHVDEMYEKLIQLGYKPNEPPKVNQQFGIYHFFITDPNGYNVEIQKFLS
ncbi:MAG TPA: VOC family protein [Bacillota bacterium]|jgi:catechol 2,3-dioxygenase-like lactoylglutathione lyase family enzyme|nr:VOC family protein [Bacillota bacterium]HOL12614.1 VOC family protein [Bacillota bacterium]HPP61484.1 VOC family protein [Bacillota bacterium]HPZ78753.1 VOC family protein [Bacillota bacterium]HQD74906.1 VOC family protein [Bacillota bacterium]